MATDTQLQKSKLFSKNDFIAGSIAGIVQVLVGQPFDLVKVRLQTGAVENKSFVQVAKDIYKNEGFKTFYKGTLSPLIGISFCVAIQFGANSFAKNILLNYNYKNSKDKKDIGLSVKQNMLTGMFAGFWNALLISPVELFRIQMQAQGPENSSRDNKTNEPKKERYTGAVDCGRKIYKKYGLKGVYHGLGVTMAREIPAYAIYFGVYESLMNLSAKHYNNDRKSVPLPLIMIYGAIAGVCLWVGTYPIDVTKSVIQAQNIDGKNQKSVLQTAKDIYRARGISGFFKGLPPALVRAPFANAATFLTYELILKRLNNKQ